MLLFSSPEGRLKLEPRGQLTELALTLTHCVIWSKSLQLRLQHAGQRSLRLWKRGWHRRVAAFASRVAEVLGGGNAAVWLLHTVQIHRLAQRFAPETPCSVTLRTETRPPSLHPLLSLLAPWGEELCSRMRYL